jgi:hypothetical protein
VRKFIPIIFLLALAIIGCDVQRGRFVTKGGRSAALSQVGLVDIVEGYSNDKDSLFQDLIYVLVICPDVKVHGSGSGIDMEKYVTTLNYSWDAESGKISIQVRWNRDSDIVTIGDKKFDRDKGNVFIVRRQTNGEIVGQQLPSLGTHAAFSEVLRHVQQQLTNDQFIASLKMYK